MDDKVIFEHALKNIQKNLDDLHNDAKTLENLGERLRLKGKEELSATIDSISKLQGQIVWIGDLAKFNLEMIEYNHEFLMQTANHLIKLARKVENEEIASELEKRVKDLEKHKRNLEWLDKFFKKETTSKD